MKESGIDWIGQIPEEWEVDFVNHIFEEHKQKNKGNKEKNLLSLSYGRIIRKSIDTSFGLLPESFDTYNIIQRGDIVLRLTDLQNDKRSLRVGLARENGIITSAYLTLRLKNICCSDSYMYYLLHTYDICKVFYNFGGGVRQGGTWSDIYKMELLIPPKNEQQKIADFLDKKTAQLDKVKDLLEEQIQKLKDYRASLIYETVTNGLDKTVPMKDSGINWIGQVPEGWEISKIRYLVTTRSEKRITDSSIPYIGLENIESQTGKFVETGIQVDKSENIVVEIGDVLFGKLRPYLRKYWRATFSSTASSEFLVFQSSELDMNFLYYAIQSDSFIEEVNTSTYGSKMPRASWEYIKNMKITFPSSLVEQQKIANLLDEKTAQIDNLIQIKNQQIKNINKQRQTLIYDYVTGKRRV